MAQRTALITQVQFSASGKTFLPGAEITTEDAKTWPEGTLTRRIENKFVSVVLVDETDAEIADEAEEASEEISKKKGR